MFILINSLDPHPDPMGCRLHDPHFTEEETEEIERFVNLPNITQQSQGLKLAAETTPLTSVQC